MAMKSELRMAKPSDLQTYADHISRIWASNGEDGILHSPIAASEKRDIEELKIRTRSSWEKQANEPGWKKTFLVMNSERVCGHLDLNSYKFQASIHRVDLGMGLEKEIRNKGTGSKLLQIAIDFCKDLEHIIWLDLAVFAENIPAVKLYAKFGFEQTGLIRDRFRINDKSIDDIHMSLKLK
jgi:RimJ/RimL family protein N-acetyltransferase